MLIWITAVLLLALLGWIGYQQGALRAAISFVGFVIAALLAMPLASLLQPVFGMLGLKHPLMQQLVGPGITFVIVSIIFQVIAHTVNQKFEYFYKYKAEHTTQLKVERLNDRVGISLGLLNGVVLFILLMLPVYVFGYLTVQIASGEEDPAT
ncbi:MAG: CvpA family protein, partial [Limisphaerales bacterium]